MWLALGERQGKTCRTACVAPLKIITQVCKHSGVKVDFQSPLALREICLMFPWLCKFIRDLRQCWQIDRIRVASSEGKWLRLAIGSHLIIRDNLWTIAARRSIISALDGDDPMGIIMQYRLIDVHEPSMSAVLRIHWNCQNRRGVMNWKQVDLEDEELCDDDIQVVSCSLVSQKISRA